MAHFKYLSNIEKKLLIRLIGLSNQSIQCDVDKVMAVKSGNEGLYSIKLYDENVSQNDNRQFGKQISEIQYLDEDDVPVIISLFVDKEDNLFEIDFWKADYSEIKKFPDV